MQNITVARNIFIVSRLYQNWRVHQSVWMQVAIYSLVSLASPAWL